jgi:hypothetical protein
MARGRSNEGDATVSELDRRFQTTCSTIRRFFKRDGTKRVAKGSAYQIRRYQPIAATAGKGRPVVSKIGYIRDIQTLAHPNAKVAGKGRQQIADGCAKKQAHAVFGANRRGQAVKSGDAPERETGSHGSSLA